MKKARKFRGLWLVMEILGQLWYLFRLPLRLPTSIGYSTTNFLTYRHFKRQRASSLRGVVQHISLQTKSLRISRAIAL